MIAFISGPVIEARDGVVVIDAGGVGYELLVSGFTLGAVSVGTRCKLLAYHLVREDADILFGFATAEEKAMFVRLIGISGVGPKTALAVLSGLSVSDLEEAVKRGDSKRISSAHGVGKKTADRIVIELGGKLAAESSAARSDCKAVTDAVGALVSLGYQKTEASRLAQAAYAFSPDSDTQTIVRLALKRK